MGGEERGEEGKRGEKRREGLSGGGMRIDGASSAGEQGDHQFIYAVTPVTLDTLSDHH